MENHPETRQLQEAFGWAARDTSGVLSPFNFFRRATGNHDITLKILFCGICHSDLHFIKNEAGFSNYPFVPGHEIIGVVVQVGCNVQRFHVGDMAGMGGLAGACGACDNCEQGVETYCPRLILTFSGIDRDGTITQGGFSDSMVVDERFAVRLPSGLAPEAAAPLLCAGISAYSPMRYFGIDKPGMHLGVVGLGGIGHLAVKFGKAMGMRVTVISTSPAKEKEAIQQLGADSFLVSRNPEHMKSAMGTMNGIIDTVPASHPVAPLIELLKSHGKFVLVGVSDKPLEVPPLPLIMGRKVVAGSAGGGMREIQEMLDFAGEHNITADVEVISMNYVNTAMERLAKGDVKYRFVIDVANTLAT